MATQLVTPKTAFPDIDLVAEDFPIVRVGISLAAAPAGTYKKGSVVISTSFALPFAAITAATDIAAAPIIGILMEAPTHDGSAVAGERHFVAVTGSFNAATVMQQNSQHLVPTDPAALPNFRLALYRRNLHLSGFPSPTPTNNG